MAADLAQSGAAVLRKDADSGGKFAWEETAVLNCEAAISNHSNTPFMSPRSYPKIFATAFALVVTPAIAQVDLAVKKVIRVDKFEFAPTIIIPDIAKRFNAEPSAVESRLKGSALASLSQESKMQTWFEGQAISSQAKA